MVPERQDLWKQALAETVRALKWILLSGSYLSVTWGLCYLSACLGGHKTEATLTATVLTTFLAAFGTCIVLVGGSFAFLITWLLLTMDIVTGHIARRATDAARAAASDPGTPGTARADRP